MAQTCPQCKSTNPSDAKFCLSCGTNLSANVEVSETDRLNKELNEAHDTISLLKTVLAEAQKQDKTKELEPLREKLKAATLHSKQQEEKMAMQAAVIEQQQLALAKKRGSPIWILFLITTLAAVAGMVAFISQMEYYKGLVEYN